MYAGDPLLPAVGDDLVAQGVTLGVVYGATEFQNPTCPPLLSYPDRNWRWSRFSSEITKLDWAPQGDGTYELIVYVSTYNSYITAEVICSLLPGSI